MKGKKNIKEGIKKSHKFGFRKNRMTGSQKNRMTSLDPCIHLNLVEKAIVYVKKF